MTKPLEPLELPSGTGGTSGSKEIGVLQAFWELFSSMKTAILLLLVLAGVSMFITFFKRDNDAVRLYHSTGYLMLLSLIGLNLAVCSINRFGLAWRRSFAPSLDVTPAQLKNAPAVLAISVPGTPEAAAMQVTAVLRARAYAVTQQVTDGAVMLYATKGRLSIWGPYLTHVSLLVIFLGAVYGGRFGFDGFINVVEGETSNRYFANRTGQPVDLPFTVKLLSFTIEHDSQHNPVAYKSDLEIHEGDRVVAHKVIDVNRPLSYKGISFFQADYGLVELVVNITAPDGTSRRLPVSITTGDDDNGKVYRLDDPSYQTLTFGSHRLTVYAHRLVPDYRKGQEDRGTALPINPAVELQVNERFPQYRGKDAWTSLGWVPVGQTVSYQGYRLTLERVVKYTGLSVACNPGIPVIYLGFALLVLGVFTSFYLTHKVLRVHISAADAQTIVVAGAISRADPVIFAQDLARLKHALTQGATVV